MNTAISNVDRARAYLAKYPPAVENDNGDGQTYRAASILVNDFALSETEAWPLLLEWNTRCLPPWDETGLRAKLRSALSCSHPKPRGNKLNAGRGNPSSSYSPSTRPELTPEQRRARWPEFRSPSKAELHRISELRNVSTESLKLMIQREMLFTAQYWGFDCWIATDASRLVAQARRLDGQRFSEDRKALTLPGSIASLPVGLSLVPEFQNLLLIEGSGDLLAAFHFISAESRETDCHAVAMLGSGQRIAESAVPRFAEKMVRVFPHHDKSGVRAARLWVDSLRPFAAKVDAFQAWNCRVTNGGFVKDLNDLTSIDPDEFENHRVLWNLCP